MFEFSGIMHPDVNDGAEQESLAEVLLEKLGMSKETNHGVGRAVGARKLRERRRESGGAGGGGG